MQHEELIRMGMARMYRGRLVPVIRGGSGESDLFPEIAADLSTLSDEELRDLESGLSTRITEVTEAPETFVTTDLPVAHLISETQGAVEALKDIRAEILARSEGEGEGENGDGEGAAGEGGEGENGDGEGEEPPGEELELSDADRQAFADLGTAAVEPEIVEPEPVVVAAAPAPARRTPMRRPARARSAVPAVRQPQRVALTAAGGATDVPLGYEFRDEIDLAEAMISRHRQFGDGGAPHVIERFSIARSDWRSDYPAERRLGLDHVQNQGLIAAATNPAVILENFLARKRAQENGAPDALVAAGGLCAPVTPYYNLQMISTPDRPVLAALPGFNADRGGIRAARPASLAAVTDGVGLITAAQDAAGGSDATKNCQVIDCPDFTETDVAIIYHCLQFGNLGARTFPELVAQWNSLTLAAHARLADSTLLTEIDTQSTQVTAGALGLGASATLFSQILAAAAGLRSRNRMRSDAVLRLMLPWWAVDLIVSDVIRGQFQRFDTDQERVVALLRKYNVEPSFYIDGAAGRGQVFGTQPDGALLPFPDTVVWYLFPEGSFLYLDGGTLELGIVRDSVLNAQNNFQIFGETFENVAFVGVESLAVETSVCDSGTVSAPSDVTCPVDYTPAS